MAQIRQDFDIHPLGDAAVLAEFTSHLDLLANVRIQRLAAALRARKEPWIRDIVPALGSLALHFDLDRVPQDTDPAEAAAALLRACVKESTAASAGNAHMIEVPVCYDRELGPDLAEVAARRGMAPREVIRRHCGSEHRVLMMGFSPGQPYIGGLDASLSVPRRSTPRTSVPAGSVAIANEQTAVYPFTISGGWNVVGRTPLTLFDVGRNPAALFAPGMKVRFVPITRGEFESKLAA